MRTSEHVAIGTVPALDSSAGGPHRPRAHSAYAYHVDDSWRNFTAAAVTGGVTHSLWLWPSRIETTIQ